MLLTLDTTELPAATRQALHEFCTREEAFKAAQAKMRQQRIAKWHRDHELRSIEGIGAQVMAIDPYWLNYWRWKLGHETVHQDPDFQKWLLKTNECFRVKSKGTKLQFASAAVPGSARRTFRKTYNPA